MANQTNPVKRKAGASKSATGIKALIMTASVAITLGGWGALAVGQAQNAFANTQSDQAVAPATNIVTQNNNTSSNSSITSSSSSRPFSVARTRSSR